jgi:hypothetical protein
MFFCGWRFPDPGVFCCRIPAPPAMTLTNEARQNLFKAAADKTVAGL